MPKTPEGSPLTIHIRGINPPPDAEHELGVQIGADNVDVRPLTSNLTWSVDVTVVDSGDTMDLGGKAVHGKKGDRFLYLAWVHPTDSALNARAKLKFADVDADLLRDSAELECTVDLTDAKGRIAAGSIRPPKVAWTAR